MNENYIIVRKRDLDINTLLLEKIAFINLKLLNYFRDKSLTGMCNGNNKLLP